jgi:hypothetical protein
MPLLSPSRACGSDPTTSKRRSEISEQARSGGGLGMQTSGYEGSHSEPEEEEEEEKLTMVVVAVTAKVGGVIDISTNSMSSTILIIGSKKQEYYLKEFMQSSSSLAKHIKAKRAVVVAETLMSIKAFLTK